ncbi:hypothetical protein YIM_07795 [Amycolatopsis sp. YIM 10]|nr:hypothetical protein YIM_07795 [Amycolatopsis sp. YIM 10]
MLSCYAEGQLLLEVFGLPRIVMAVCGELRSGGRCAASVAAVV